MSFATEIDHALQLEAARREFALEMAVEREYGAMVHGYEAVTADGLVEMAQKFYDFLAGDEDDETIKVTFPAQWGGL